MKKCCCNVATVASIYLMPTELRKGQHYIMLYSSWFWVIVTGPHTADTAAVLISHFSDCSLLHLVRAQLQNLHNHQQSAPAAADNQEAGVSLQGGFYD